MSVEIWLPYPPSVNRLWRTGRGRVYRSDAYIEWLREAGWEIKKQKPGKVAGPYKISITAARPDKRKRDLCNLEKAISDVIEHHGIIENDSLCEMQTSRWVTTGDGVAVRIEPVGVE